MAVPQVLLQHAHEAAFLWLLRSQATESPHYSLPDLAKLDDRVEAHLDALRIAGDEGWKFCAEQLAVNEVGEVFAAAILALDSPDKTRLAQVLEAASAEADLADGIISACGWLPLNSVAGHLSWLLSSEPGALRRVGLGACAAHRHDPGTGLRTLLRDEDTGVRARALRLVGELGRRDLSHEVSAGTAAEEPEVRFWACWSTGVLSGEPSALSALQSTVAGLDGPQMPALELLIRRLPVKESRALHQRITQSPDQDRTAVICAGVIGDPDFVPWLLGKMPVASLARRAGEAITMITGVDLAYSDLERDAPEGFNAGPTEDPEDENVSMDPDENLPWPDPVLVQKWWEKHRGQFQNGTRYLLGKPMTVDWLKVVLRDGRQRQRAAAALELAIRNPGQPLFNVKAPGFRQIQLLGKPQGPIR